MVAKAPMIDARTGCKNEEGMMVRQELFAPVAGEIEER